MKSSGNKKVAYYWAIYNDGSLILLERPKKGYSPKQVCANYAKTRGVPWGDLEPHLSAKNLGDNWRRACSTFQKLPHEKQELVGAGNPKPIVSEEPKDVWIQAEISFGQEIYDY